MGFSFWAGDWRVNHSDPGPSIESPEGQPLEETALYSGMRQYFLPRIASHLIAHWHSNRQRAGSEQWLWIAL